MNLTELADEALVRRGQKGDREAFGELVRRHRDNTYRLCLKMLGTPEDAEDNAQEALVKAYQALPGFRQNARFSTWLYRIAVNVCLGTLRKRKLPTVSIDRPIDFGDGAAARDVVDSSPDPQYRLLADEFSTLVQRQLDELSQKNRTVFDLRVNQRLSTEDTAVILGVSTSCVKSRLHRARSCVREGLTDYLGSE
ncbi:MAG: sigma-70 family RNA polymerase sigma factor [Candidatus Eisenbacteria bacterium]|nr:sigma-70 family RNA polymerase sigma factor [Candidatus Eisenbacteria bacterium]